MSKEIRYVEKGNELVLKQDLEPLNFNHAQVLHRIDILRKELSDADVKVSEANNTIKSYEKHKEKVSQELREIAKYETKYTEYQVVKLKALMEDVKELVFKRVVDEYEFDDMLNVRQNKAQMFAQYRAYIARDPKISEVIYGGILNKQLMRNGLKLDNPFKDHVFEGITEE